MHKGYNDLSLKAHCFLDHLRRLPDGHLFVLVNLTTNKQEKKTYNYALLTSWLGFKKSSKTMLIIGLKTTLQGKSQEVYSVNV